MTALDKLTARVAFGDDPHTVSNTWHTLTGVRRVVTTTSNRTRTSDSFVAGSAQITVDASDREYDPTYSSSTHAGDFKWGTPVEVYDDSTRYLFRGYAVRFTPKPGTFDSETVIDCVDGLGLLSEFALPGQAAAFAGDSGQTRMTRILDTVNWPTDDRELDAERSLMSSTVYGIKALSEIVRVGQSVGGLIYHSPHDNSIHFEGRHAVQTRSRMATSQATFGTGGYGIIEGSLIVPGVGDGFRNIVRVATPDGVTHTAGSITATESERAIDRSSSAQRVGSLPQFLLDLYGTETPAPGKWQVMAAIGSTSVDQAAAATRLRDRVTVAYDPAGAGTESFEVLVNSITHVATASDWTVTFTAEPAEPYDDLTAAGEWMEVGDATLGQVGTGKVGY